MSTIPESGQTLINTNSNTGVINRCKLEVTNSSKESFLLSWSSFCKDEGNNWENESQIYPIAIEGKSSVKKVVTYTEDFEPVKKLYFAEGNYNLKFMIWVSGKKNAYREKSYNLSISKNIVDLIEASKSQYPKRCNSGHVFIEIQEL